MRSTARARRRRGHRATELIGALVLLAAGCPSRLEPRSAPAETLRSPNGAAQDAFAAGEAKFQQGDMATARQQLERFLEIYPGDPLVPVVRLDAGRAAYALGDYAAARADLSPIVASETTPAPASQPATPSDIAEKARFYLGLALVHVGDPRGARSLLLPLEPRIAPGDAAVELHAALAEAAAQLGLTTEALTEYDEYFAGATRAERAYLLRRVHELAGSLAHDAALQAFGAVRRDGLAAAFLGRRLAGDAEAQGDHATAGAFLVQARAALEAAGLATPSAPAQVLPETIGLLLPLTGRASAVGEAALQGALLAAGAASATSPPGGGTTNGATLEIRDTGCDPARAAAAVGELAAAGAIAVVGPVDRAEVGAAAARARREGIPLLSLAVASTDAADAAAAGDAAVPVFAVLHPPEERARALASFAVRTAGTRRIAILRPQNEYGQRMADAFAAEVADAGGRVVDTETYDVKATSFVKPARSAAEDQADAVFVADSAHKLELVAPALALAGLWSVPPGGAAPRHERPVLLLSTAEGLSPQLVTAAGRYVQGAVLAPGFYPDESDPRAAAFVDSFQGAYEGDEPGLFAAASYAAVRTVIGAAAAGARSRDGLVALLTDPRAPIAQALGPALWLSPVFTPDGTRIEPPALYQVQGDAIHRLEATSAR